MADRVPLATPGDISEIASSDRIAAAGIVYASGQMTFADSVTGTKTLADLATGGGGGGTILGTVGAVDNRVPRSDGVTADTLQASLLTLLDSGALSLVSTDGDTVPLHTWGQSGANGATGHVTFGGRTPVGNVTGAPGDLYVRISAATSSIYQHQGSVSDNTSWTDLTAWVRGSLGATANVVAVTSGTGGKTLQASPMTVNASTGELLLTGTMADTLPLTTLGQSGTNGATLSLFFGARDPTSNVTGNPGDVYFRDNGTSSAIYQHRGAVSNTSGWVALATGGGTILGSVGGVANRIPVSSGTGGVTLQAGLITSDPTTGVTSIVGTPADTSPVLSFGQSGTNGSTVNLTFSTRTPASNITGNPGDIVVRKNGTSSSIFLHTGSVADNTSWTDLTGWIRGTLGATANRVPVSSGTGGLTLQASLLTIDPATGAASLVGTMADTSALLTWQQSGTNGGTAAMYFGSRDPTSNVSAAPGSIYFRTSGTTSQVYQHRGSVTSTTGWALVGTGIGGTTGATDNAVLRADGTLGATAQGSTVTISDTGSVQIPSGQTIDMQSSSLVSLGYVTISPTAIAAQQNNYSPTGWSGSEVVRLTFTGSQTITGFDATATAVRKVIENIDTVDTLTLSNESASSTAANRLTCPNGTDLLIPPGGSVTVIYDATSTRWRPIEVNNGAVVIPSLLLHAVRRSVQLTNITSAIFPGYDTTLQSINSSYWSYSSGTWTCNKAHVSMIETRMSYQTNSGAVMAAARVEPTWGTGGTFTNMLQRHEDSSYSTTDTLGHLTSRSVRSWSVNDQFRIFYSTSTGAMDILAAENECFVHWVSG